MKAKRNKTIDLGVEDGGRYLDRCLTLRRTTPLDEVLDKTILGDTFEVLPRLSGSFIVKLLNESHDVNTSLTKGRTNRRSRSSFTSLDLKLYHLCNLLCHLIYTSLKGNQLFST